MAKSKQDDRLSLRRIQEVLCPVTTAGALLANLAFNLKQDKGLPEHVRKSLAECQEQWDEAIRKVPNRWRI